MKSSSGRTGRRAFLQSATLAGALAGQDKSAAQPPAQTPATKATSAAPQREVAYPRTFTGRQLAMVAFPLGGVGAGSISLGGRGQLRDWEIFNRPDKRNSPRYSFPAIWVQSGAAKPVARVLEGRILPPYEGASGLGSANVPGLPRLKSCTFTGEFPMARVAFADADLPVKVALEAFTPFVPLEADDSGLPVAVLRYRVSNPGAAKAKVAIAFSVTNPVGQQGHNNAVKQGGGLVGLLFTNPFLPNTDALSGSFALSAIPAGGKVTTLTGWRAGKHWPVGPLIFWDDFTADGELGPDPPVRDATGSVCLTREIAARGVAEFTFLLSWHFPNRTPERCGWTAPKGDEKTVIGNHYCTRFKDAWAAAEYAAGKLPELEAKTRAFVSAMRKSTLPAAVKEAASANLSTLVTTTCFRTADGNFHGFEGSSDQRGCCFGNCNHVWNYEVATSSLFPSLARSLRESSFGFCTDERGKMDVRQLLPAGKEHYGYAAADGSMGQIMRLYFDWRASGDRAWLRRLWPAAKRALEFAWVEGGWDGDRDGVMEGVQHNTYDVEFLGPNPLCSVWYLGALRAAEEMAKVLGDDAAAAAYRKVFTSGSKWIDAHLFNGEFYVQQIRGIPKEKIAPGLVGGMGANNTESPDFQVGDGCLIDQLLGQYFAYLVGLGSLLDPAHIKKAAQSLWKYNYKRDLHRWESVQRVYALNDEAAMVICDYSHGKRPEVPFPYFAEVMTGFEHAAASLMLAEGMTTEGLTVIESIRRRYDGERRNPWDEAECGHHYARAMASWSALRVLSGFDYDGGSKRVSVRPRAAGERFQSFWSTASGWGTFTRTPRQVTVQVEHGTLACASLHVDAPAQFGGKTAAKVGTTTVATTAKREGSIVAISFAHELVVKTGETLTLNL
jgi:non-lysosomal glucosylceramidase